MAVVIQCYHCETILELDEGFRGGVCRCSNCGSLLQVPKAAAAGGAPKARPAAPGAAVSETKRPANPNEDPGLSRGQFDHANQPGAGGGSGASGVRPAVPDFGGSSSGLRQGRPAAPVATAKAPHIEKVSPISGPTRPGAHLRRVKKNNTLLYVGLSLLGLLMVAAIVVIVVTVMNQGQSETTPKGGGTTGAPASVAGGGSANGATNNQSTNPPPPASPLSQGFFGIPLVGQQIVISVDAASSMNDTFDYVRAGVYQAMGSLKPGQTLRVALWKGDSLTMLPAQGFYVKSELPKLRAAFDAVSAMGASDAGACMAASMKVGGDQVIFITAKDSLQLSIADGVLAARTGNTRIDGIKIESRDDPSPLELLAGKTGGKYEFVRDSELAAAVK